jgi:hypothetical protein
VFTLNIPVTSGNIAAIKAELTRTLPDVKSSHRCEAAARGLGYKTYASILAAGRSTDVVIATARGAAFSAYLADHGFDVPPLLLYRAAARVAIRAVLDHNPKLSMHGIGAGRPRLTENNRRETPQEHYAKFLESREELLGDHALEEFLRALAFLGLVPPTKTVRPGTDSYRLKHIAENYRCTYPEGEELGPNYVSNGALIAAAIHAGFRYRTYMDDLGYDSLNVDFNMSKAVLDDLDCEIRPNGARAQSRRMREQMRNPGPLRHAVPI